jgi:hypothetical protein
MAPKERNLLAELAACLEMMGFGASCQTQPSPETTQNSLMRPKAAQSGLKEPKAT